MYSADIVFQKIFFEKFLTFIRPLAETRSNRQSFLSCTWYFSLKTWGDNYKTFYLFIMHCFGKQCTQIIRGLTWSMFLLYFNAKIWDQHILLYILLIALWRLPWFEIGFHSITHTYVRYKKVEKVSFSTIIWHLYHYTQNGHEIVWLVCFSRNGKK